MRKQLFIKGILLFLALVLFSACATPTSHKVDINAIDKNKTFRLGIVKVAADFVPIMDQRVAKRIMALEKIPVKEICDTLSSNYGLKIDTDIDKTVKIVRECPPSGGLLIMSKNPYWGNKAYIKDDDTGDIVNITYSMVSVPIFKQRLCYEIIAKSDGKVVLELVGVVATVGTPKKGLFIDEDARYDIFISYADKINEAFVRDIKKTK